MIESLCCTPETNVTKMNYTSIFKSDLKDSIVLGETLQVKRGIMVLQRSPSHSFFQKISSFVYQVPELMPSLWMLM